MHSHSNHLQSILMPGALHHPGSSFMCIYYKDTYKYSILLETCTQDGFEYAEYYSYKETPGFFESIGGSDLFSEYHLPKKDHQKDYILQRINDLQIDKFKMIFSGEVDSLQIIQYLEREIELESTKVCSLYEAISGLKEIKSPVYYDHLGLCLVDTKCVFSEKFYFGLQQISSGALANANGKIIDLSGNDGTGLAGNGCTKALINCFESAQSQYLQGAVINLSGNKINEAHLLQAITLGKIPLGIVFNGLSREFNLYYCFNTFMQCINEYPNEFLLNLDVQMNILNILMDFLAFELKGKKERQFTLMQMPGLFQKREASPAILCFDRRNQQQLAKKLSICVGKKLDFSFSYRHQNFVLISGNLQAKIQIEIEDIFSEILPRLDSIQINILLKIIRGDIDGYSLATLIGSIKIKQGRERNFSIVSGDGLEPCGLAGDYYNNISCDLISLRFRENGGSISASHDELKHSYQTRKMQACLWLYTVIAKAANHDELAILIEDSKNRNSSCMEFLCDNETLFTKHGQTYCKALNEISENKQMDFVSLGMMSKI